MRAFLALFVLLGTTLPANAQLAAVPADTAGTWYGLVHDFPGEQRRILTITQTPSGHACTWDEVDKDHLRQVACRVTGTQVKLVTAAQSDVELTLASGQLGGTFTPSRGKNANRSFRVVMSANPQLVPGWVVTTASTEQFDPKQLRSMPTLQQIPRPNMTAEQVMKRCLQHLASAEYSGTVVAEGAWAREQVRMFRYTLYFSTEGKAAETRLADGRPTCAVWQSTKNWAAYPEKVPASVHFDGVHLIRHTKANRGSIHILQPEGSLAYVDFFAYSDTSDLAQIRKRWGTLSREP